MCSTTPDTPGTTASTNEGTKGDGGVVEGAPKGPSGRDMGVWDSSLEDRANCLSRWTLSYLTPLLRLGGKKIIEAEDVGVPSKEDRASRAYSVALDAWTEQSAKADAVNEKRRASYEAKLTKCSTQEQRLKVKEPAVKEPSIAWALLKGFGAWQLIIAMVYYVVSALLTFVPVLLLNDLVKFFERGGSSDNYQTYVNPWVEVVGLGVLPVIISALQTRHQVVMAHCAVFVRTAVSTLLYRKSLRVSAAGRAKTSTGQVVNMMSNDTAQLQRFLQFGGMTMVAPIQIVLSLYLIFQQVGNATWVGVAFLICLAPINVLVFSVVSKMRRKVLKYSDLRVKMMNEILTGIRIIKFYAWEIPFGKEVERLRDKELQALTNLSYVSAVGFSLILMSAPIIQPILVFLTYVNVQDEPLTAATAFTTVALFNIMRFPFAFMPMGLLQYIQSRISLRRLERYLQLPELGEYVISEPPSDDSQIGRITIQDGSFSWVDPDAAPVRPVQEEKKKKPKKKRRNSETSDADEAMRSSMHSQMSSTYSVATDEESIMKSPITLQDITTNIAPGSLVAVVGTVGSGKSSLLSAILGEMESIHGSNVYIARDESDKDKIGFTSYCAQTPWVVNDTLRGNILFGREFNQERYDKVVDGCALTDDFAVLPAGDQTEIGERGINLSGGQKARVSLARAMYSEETRILLLDDPLSAVDAHVGEHLFANAVSGEISKGATRVLVTHHVQVLSRCDNVIVMKHGRIQHQGKYEDLIAKGVDFAGAVDVSKAERTESTSEIEEEIQSSDELKTSKKTAGLQEETDAATEKKEKADLKEKGENLISKEEREEGSVASSAYLKYARAGGLCVFLLAILVQGLGRGFEVVGAFWLSFWAEQTVEGVLNNDPLTDGETSFYVGIYALWGFLSICGLTCRGLILAVHRLRASRTLHDDLTESVLRAPVSFFDVTPIGRILNRFAADMDKIDLQLTQSLGQGFSTIFSVLGAVGAIIAATKGTFLVPLIPLSYIYYLIQKWFRKTSTELQRVNSIANSPIFADFSQTLSGTSTIRAYGEEGRFFLHCQQSFDTMNASYLLVQLTNYWLGLRLDVLGGLVGAFIGGIAVATASADFIPAGWLGLALSYSIEMTGFLKHGVRMIATIEAEMNSVERVLYYSENIEPEAPYTVPGKDPPEGTWPSAGEIDISHASIRYRDGPLVLKDLSLTIKAGEKVGVVGRTGSGKSSLMVMLFRISELEPDGGKVEIDEVNTSEIGTSVLRLNLSIIPQDPIMFSNTVRYNIDPFAKAPEEDLWTVLKKVQLADVIAALPRGLDEEVAEGGENFSQGQRQLLCIARALLRNPKVLVMDEATASIDNTTDAAIQTMIRENFANATVLTIAHRLNTIMDSDRILVLDDGRIAEFDTPQALLRKENGQFKAMVEKSKAAHDDFLDEDD